jgi:hypothetical protein
VRRGQGKSGWLEEKVGAWGFGALGCASGDDDSKGKGRSRFPEGMTERKAKATAKATTNAGVLRFAQDDGEKQTTATAKAKTISTATKTATATTKGNSSGLG